MNQLRFLKLTPNAFPPTKGSEFAAGYDLSSLTDVVLPKEDRCLVSTGLAIVLPDNCYGRLAPRSGLSLRLIDVGAGVIDRDYTGEIMVLLINHSKEDYKIGRGDKIAQLICECIVYPTLVEISKIETTSRGCQGFGSTGR